MTRRLSRAGILRFVATVWAVAFCYWLVAYQGARGILRTMVATGVLPAAALPERRPPHPPAKPAQRGDSHSTSNR